MTISNSGTRRKANHEQLKRKTALSQLKLSTVIEENLVLETRFMANCNYKDLQFFTE